jgi:predicted RNase H-like HicB family nuclease
MTKSQPQVYTVVVHEEDDKADGYWAQVVELPGCFGSGETLEELREDITDAIGLYLNALEDNSWPMPEPQKPTEPVLQTWQVAVPALVD